MRLCSIASGSSGNCIYTGTQRSHILIDAGISRKKTEEGLHEIGIDASEIEAILITHEHSDHIGGLGVFSRKYQVPMYATPATIRAILDSGKVGRIEKNLFVPISAGEDFRVGDLEVHPISTSHDAADPVAYVIRHEGRSEAVITDLGKYDSDLIAQLQGLDVLLLEANHDVRMLEAGIYPYYLKQRILGERGHLSNEASGQLLNEVLHDGMKRILLGHLSKENNFAPLALETVQMEVTMGPGPYKGKDFPISVAQRDAVSELIEF